MPFEAFKPVFKALPKLGFVGLAPALVITQCLITLRLNVFNLKERSDQPNEQVTQKYTLSNKHVKQLFSIEKIERKGRKRAEMGKM